MYPILHTAAIFAKICVLDRRHSSFCDFVVFLWFSTFSERCSPVCQTAHYRSECALNHKKMCKITKRLALRRAIFLKRFKTGDLGTLGIHVGAVLSHKGWNFDCFPRMNLVNKLFISSFRIPDFITYVQCRKFDPKKFLNICMYFIHIKSIIIKVWCYWEDPTDFMWMNNLQFINWFQYTQLKHRSKLSN